MPAADLGEENPLPPLRSGRDLHTVHETGPGIPADMKSNFRYGHLPSILPYTMQDGYDRNRQTREFRAAVLENEFLRATFLPELGGRLWSLVHKPAGRELLAVNPAFQPANLALRNAWFSGGVEWNIGTIGHSPFTCSPLFAARVERADGTPILRLYEWERIRQTPFQIDAALPDGSPLLFVTIRIGNPHDREVPMYWWSNMAVPETADTRVIVPAQSAYRFNYSKLDLIPVPVAEGSDITYAANMKRSADYFYHIPDGRRHWISALDGEGKGLLQASTGLLKGRKLFVWGMGSGGRRWQQFLAPTGQPYIEIQAGLARTQLEHLPMPAGEWSWLEAYGLMETDPATVHSRDWRQAHRLVEKGLEELVPRAVLEAEFARSMASADSRPVEILQRGSGWGALERLRREVVGERPFCTEGLIFDDDSLGGDQEPWLQLLREGFLPVQPPDRGPGKAMVQSVWRERLEKSVQKEAGDNWAAWLHLGVMRYYAGEKDGARRAWERSRARSDNAWAVRNLAVLAREKGRFEQAAELYSTACRLQPDLLPLLIECGRSLIEAGQGQAWLELVGDLPYTVRGNGRVRLLEAQAGLVTGNLQIVERFFADGVVVADIREGETSLSDLWFDFQAMRLSLTENVPLDEALRARVRRMLPVADGFDFRMGE